MSSNSRKMGYCVIIRGPLGVGKTTVAQALAERLGAHYISIDAVLAAHDLDQSDGECIPAENFIRANELALPQAKAALNAGQVVIFDGNFYHSQQLAQLTQQVAVPVYGFTLRAPLSVCVERDRQRQRTYGIGAATAVYTLVSRVEYGIDINTEDQTVSQTIAAIEAHLPHSS